MWSARSTPAAASRSSAIRTIGAATCRSIAACGISTRSASISTATPIRISRRSRRASTTCARRPIPAAGRPPTTSPRCATAASSRRHSPTACRRSFSGLVFNTRRPVFSDIRVREAIAHAVRLRMAQPQFLLRPLRALGELFRRLRALGARPARGAARARAARAVSRRGARRLHGRHLAAAGSRRLRPRPRHAQARARAARRRPATSSTARCCARARRDKPLRLRDPGHHPGPGAAGARLLARPQARRHRGARARGRCRAIRPAATHLRFRHDRVPLGPVALARQRAGVLLGLRRGRRRRHAQLHGRQKPGDRRHDRGAAEGRASATSSSRRCARSTAC